LYYGHRGEPFGRPSIPSLRNRFLCYGHDDGWYLRLHYIAWRDVAEILAPVIRTLAGPSLLASLLSNIRAGRMAFWMSQHRTRSYKKTHDIDRVLATCRGA
jgi:hypothetical protein